MSDQVRNAENKISGTEGHRILLIRMKYFVSEISLVTYIQTIEIRAGRYNDWPHYKMNDFFGLGAIAGVAAA